MNYNPQKHQLKSDGSKRPTLRITSGDDEISIYGDVWVETGDEDMAGLPIRVTSAEGGVFCYVVYGVNDVVEARVLEGHITTADLFFMQLGI